MKNLRKAIATAALLALIFPLPHMAQEAGAQDHSEKRPEGPKPLTPLRLQIVFSEFDSERKVSALPYTLLVNADSHSAPASIRMGLKVPLINSKGDVTYMDLGTNIDGRAEKQEDGRFKVQLNVERSSVYNGDEQQSKLSLQGSRVSNSSPVIQQFRSQLDLLLRDGQTILSTVSTDPLTGRILKVDVTLNVLKP